MIDLRRLSKVVVSDVLDTDKSKRLGLFIVTVNMYPMHGQSHSHAWRRGNASGGVRRRRFNKGSK
eukprot:7150351-Ditylum_brightwellii.AAC.1